MGIDVTLSTNAVKYLGSAANKMNSSTQKLMTGKKNPGESVVSVLKGLQNEATAKVLSAVAESAKYGSTVLDIASSHLYDLLDNLTELRTTIAQADTADSSVLANLNALYQSKVAAIISELTNANFGGKLLFDGSNTTASNPITYSGVDNKIPEDGVPEDASPLSIRVGETFNNNISINIPRLLSGFNCSNPDIPVSGRITPLFPVSNDDINIKDRAADIFSDIVIVLKNSNAGPNSNDNAQDANTNVQAINKTQRTDSANNPQGLSDEQKTMLKAAQDAAAAAYSKGVAGGATADIQGANYIRNATLYAVLDAVSPYISSDAISAYRAILDIEKTYPMKNTSTQKDYRDALQNLTLPGNIVGDDIIKFVKQHGIATVTKLDGTTVSDGSEPFDAQKDDMFRTIIKTGSINANPVSAAGNLLTSVSRKKADGVVVAATETVKSLIASVVGQQSILDGSIDSLNTQIAANKEAANDLLSANIVEASNEVKQILSLIQSVYFVLGNVDKINQLNAILLQS